MKAGYRETFGARIRHARSRLLESPLAARAGVKENAYHRKVDSGARGLSGRCIAKSSSKQGRTVDPACAKMTPSAVVRN